MRQLAGIALVEHLPVGAVHVGVVEFLACLVPDVFEGLLAPSCGVVVVEGFEVHVGDLAVGDFQFLDASACGIVGGLAVVGEVKSGEADALCLDGGASFLEVSFPEGGAVGVVRCDKVELGAFLVEHGIADVAAVEGQAHRAEVEFAEIQRGVGSLDAVFLGLLFLSFLFLFFLLFVGFALLSVGHLLALLLGFLLFLLVLRLLSFLLLVLAFLLGFVEAFAFLLVHAETLVGVGVEEGDVEVALSAP